MYLSRRRISVSHHIVQQSMHPTFYSVRCPIDLPGSPCGPGTLATNPRPPRTFAHPSERDTGMTHASVTGDDEHHLIATSTHVPPSLLPGFARRVDDPTKHGKEEEENVSRRTRNRTKRARKNKTKTGAHQHTQRDTCAATTYALRALRWKGSGRVSRG